jgi:hypothetical protein
MSGIPHSHEGESGFPSAQEPWFRALPLDRRDELVREWRARNRRAVELSQTAQRRVWIEMAQTAAVFAVADLICPRRSVFTVLVLVVCGALCGLIGNRAEMGQVRSGAIGLAVFFVTELVMRNGLSAMHLFVCFPLGCACAYLGWRRTERVFD